MRKLDRIEWVKTPWPRVTEHLYRKKWLEVHKDASVIVCEEATGFPVRAEYKYAPTDMEPPEPHYDDNTGN